MNRSEAHLVFADGTTFSGLAAGACLDGQVGTGEVIFNTALSGYQEVVTDPSYAGQIITFTYPHIGNYGVTSLDDESSRPWCEGVIVRDLATHDSNWRSEGSLEGYLRERSVPVLTGIDTRRLTRYLRTRGAVPAVFGARAPEELRTLVASATATNGQDFVQRVSTPVRYERGTGDVHIVAFDFGIKAAMVSQLAARFRLTVVPATTSANEVLALRPDGVFLSNGPGDPAALGYIVSEIRQLLGVVPIFGICLGHQLLATALGGRTYKLEFGHHGSNHPVKDLATGHVEITAQNHNYAVDASSLSDAVVSHVNLNDGVVEGLRADGLRCFSVQYHPEAGPGPHDARYLFDRFCNMLDDANSGGN